MSTEAAFDDPRFVLQRRLGAGGMGVVYQALDRERNQVVALKTLRDPDAAAIVRFKQEFRALADVTHPNLVSLYELIAHPGRLFFTMELVIGRSFLRWVRDERGSADRGDHQDDEGSTAPVATSADTSDSTEPGRKRPSEPSAASRRSATPAKLADPIRLRSALRELAEGVAALHQAGVLHRDLKPSNVMVTPHGMVKILDFGLATELRDAQPGPEEFAGTAAYMSPEQGARLALGPGSDWYSVGVMIYEALTGRLPFVGTRTEMLMDRQLYEPPPPSELVPSAPDDLNALCVALLRRDPQARPDGREVLRRLGATSSPRASSHRSAAGGAQLVGRERHLGALDDAWTDVRDGRSVIQLVHGASGMGKTVLVRHFLDRAAEAGALVFSGRCYERESVPFKALDSLVDAVSQWLARLPRLEAEGLIPRDVQALARLFPVLRQVEAVLLAPRRQQEALDPREARRRAFAALRELLARIADRHPVVLAIDDLQWGDLDSAQLLASVLRPPDAPALLLLACCRSEEWSSSPFLAELREQLTGQGSDLRELEVGALTTEDAERLVRLLLRAEDDDAAAPAQARRIAQEAGGSPFFIDELVRHVSDGEATAPALISLDEVLRARVRRLPPDAARLLAIVAVAGRPMALPLALRAAELYEQSPLAVLKAGNLARTRGGVESSVVECYHDRVREAALALLSPKQLAHAHLRVAITLESSPQPDADALALHFHEAGDSERAAEYAERAAERAAETLAFDRAARLYRLALSLRPAGAARGLRVKLGDALAHAGRGPEAAEAFLAATAQASAAEVLDLQRRAAAQLLRAGRIAEGIAAFREVLDAVGMPLAPTPGRALASLLWRRARVRLRGLGFRERDESQVPADQLMRIDVAYAVTTGLGMVDSVRAADFGTRQLLLALEVGEPTRVARALAAEACMLSMRGTHTAARTERACAALEALAARRGTDETRALVVGVRGIMCFQVGQYRRGFELCQEASELLRDHCPGLHWELTTARAFALFSLGRMGRFRLLCERLIEQVPDANERGDLYAATNMICAVGCYRWLTRDDPDGARRELTEAVARWNVTDSFHLQHFNATLSQSYVDLYLGDGAQAWQRLQAAWPAFEGSVLLRMQTLRANACSVRSRAALALAHSGRSELASAAEADARRLEREGAPYCRALALMIRATLAHLRGKTQVALEGLAASERAFDELDMSFNAVAARWRRGQLLGGSEGEALLAQARARCAEEGVVAPERMIALFAPGW